MTVDELQAEVDRLTRERDAALREIRVQAQAAGRVEAEVERLRAAVNEANVASAKAAIELEQQQGDNERLRAALAAREEVTKLPMRDVRGAEEPLP